MKPPGDLDEPGEWFSVDAQYGTHRRAGHRMIAIPDSRRRADIFTAL